MKHLQNKFNKYLYPNPLKDFLKFFFSFIPYLSSRKIVWYSERYNTGERFLLKDLMFYPYQYSEHYLPSDPVRNSIRLLNALKEYQIACHITKWEETSELNLFKIRPDTKDTRASREYLKIQYEIYKNMLYKVRNTRKVEKVIKTETSTLLHLVRVNMTRKENLDFPAIVPAIILYSITNYKTEQVEKEIIELLLEKFLCKLEYADADSISYVIQTLDKLELYDKELWIKLTEELKKKKFELELTPLELQAGFIVDKYKDYFENKRFGFLGMNLFYNGNLEVYEAYNSIKSASRYLENLKGFIPYFEARFPMLKKTN